MTPIAHRGLYNNRAGVPENSLAAFDAAIRSGYPIELDVQLLKDGNLAVFHDQNLERMTGQNVAIGDRESTFLKTLRLLSTDQKLPLFQSVLQFVNGKVPLLIEIKNRDKLIGLLEHKLFEILQGYTGEVAVESFNPFSLHWFYCNAPQIPRGQLSGDFRAEPLPRYKKFLLKNLLYNFLSKPDFIAYDFRCLPYWPVAFATRSKPLIAWTIRTRSEHNIASRYCDNIIFEGYKPNSIEENGRDHKL